MSFYSHNFLVQYKKLSLFGMIHDQIKCHWNNCHWNLYKKMIVYQALYTTCVPATGYITHTPAHDPVSRGGISQLRDSLEHRLSIPKCIILINPVTTPTRVYCDRADDEPVTTGAARAQTQVANCEKACGLSCAFHCRYFDFALQVLTCHLGNRKGSTAEINK